MNLSQFIDQILHGGTTYDLDDDIFSKGSSSANTRDVMTATASDDDSFSDFLKEYAKPANW